MGLFIICHFLPFFYFLTLETGEFTGHAKATFPYLLVVKDGQMIYSPNCVPKGFCLSDPDHLTGLKITNLYSHWLGHQKRKLQPFVISNADPLHGMFVEKSEKAKGKKKVEYVDVSSKDGSEEEDGEASSDEVGHLQGNWREDESDTSNHIGTEPLTLNFGPPIGKQKKNPPSEESSSCSAGPSKLLSPDQPLMKKHAKYHVPPKMAAKKSSALIHQPAENGPVKSQVSIPPSACLLKLIKFSESQGGKSHKKGERKETEYCKRAGHPGLLE